MTDEPPDLRRIQRWMQTVIRHPDGVAAGLDAAEARAELDVGAGGVSRVIRRSRAQTEIERLAVYGNAYYARLLECLRDEFPAVRQALGDRLFDGFAFGYLQACPSKSYTLSNLGARFAGYLRETRPERDAGTAAPDWADFLIDLARLERAYAEIFDGPGTEGETGLDSSHIFGIPAECWPDARLVPAPCLRLMNFQFPVHDYKSAVRRGESPDVPAPNETFLAIFRRDFVVRRSAVTEMEYRLLERLSAGDTLSAAIDAATEKTEIPDDELGSLLRRWFQEWTAARMFVRVESPG